MHASSYHVADQLHIGNGQSLSISHIGHSNVISSSNLLHLNNLLYVPSITKNLVSVSKFARDNSVFFEFHPYSCFVKSQATKEVLLQGVLGKDGLYRFNSFQLQHLQSSSPTPSCGHSTSNSSRPLNCHANVSTSPRNSIDSHVINSHVVANILFPMYSNYGTID